MAKKKKYVKIMCDYCAEGVWNADGASISLNSLPIPFWLKTMIQQWQNDYERSWDADDTFDWETFSKTGIALAVKVKQALPDWTVMYHDEQKAMDAFSRVDNSYYLYEITLPEKHDCLE